MNRMSETGRGPGTRAGTGVRRLMLVAAAVTAAMAGLAGPAYAADSAADSTADKGSTTVDVQVDTYDARGTLLASDITRTVGSAAGDTCPGGEVCSEASAGLAYLGKSASGCKTMTVTISRYSTLGTLQFRYSQTKSWCWKSNKVLGPNYAGAPVYYSKMTNNDGFHYLRIESKTAHFYYYSTLGSNSGHFSETAASIEFCPTTCWWIEYPYIDIDVHGDGTWRYYWYDGD